MVQVRFDVTKKNIRHEQVYRKRAWHRASFSFTVDQSIRLLYEVCVYMYTRVLRTRLYTFPTECPIEGKDVHPTEKKRKENREPESSVSGPNKRDPSPNTHMVLANNAPIERNELSHLARWRKTRGPLWKHLYTHTHSQTYTHIYTQRGEIESAAARLISRARAGRAADLSGALREQRLADLQLAPRGANDRVCAVRLLACCTTARLLIEPLSLSFRPRSVNSLLRGLSELDY